MTAIRTVSVGLLAAAFLAPPIPAAAQGTVADYQRAMGLRDKHQGLAPNVTDQARWLENTNRFLYRRTVKGGYEFVLVEADWRNLKDAGFPDRILWHKALAAKYPYYDITRVGLYGTSAGGQSALGGLLFFPDFYKAAVSSAGCHDNRMDKIWWNEQWMGWPIGAQYAESSNVDHAHRLQGKLLLVVGEMDNNVDPASTHQVVNQLIKHNKDFDLLVVPGMGHGSGGAYGDHKRYDFFARHLLGVKPPDWKLLEKPAAASTTTTQAAQ